MLNLTFPKREQIKISLKVKKNSFIFFEPERFLYLEILQRVKFEKIKRMVETCAKLNVFSIQYLIDSLNNTIPHNSNLKNNLLIQFFVYKRELIKEYYDFHLY